LVPVFQRPQSELGMSGCLGIHCMDLLALSTPLTSKILAIFLFLLCMAKCCGVHPSWLFDFVIAELRKKGTLLSCSMPNNIFFLCFPPSDPSDNPYQIPRTPCLMSSIHLVFRGTCHHRHKTATQGSGSHCCTLALFSSCRLRDTSCYVHPYWWSLTCH